MVTRFGDVAAALTWVVLAACSAGEAKVDSATTGPTDGDADTDTDADADGDTDTDVDTDPPTGDTGAPTTDTSPTTPGHVFDAAHVLVMPDANGLTLLRNDGTIALARTWSQLVGSCNACGGEGASIDGDGLLVSFTTGFGFDASGIARISAAGALDFRVDGFAFAHDAVRDPADGAIIVPEATSDEITWVAGDGSSNDALRRIDDQDDGFEGGLPNGIDRFDYDGRSYLVSSQRGGGGFGGGGPSGHITMWDITDPTVQTLVWRYPEDGSLDTPHGALFRQYGGQWWLLYAHTEGADDGDGSIGLAVTADPTLLPEYVADLLPVEPVDPFDFVRGVELTEDGWLYLTDSGGNGGFGGSPGKVVAAPMPALSPTGATGAIGDQVFEDMVGNSVLADGFDNPFEGFLWVPTFPIP